jgi:hypothetical protein
MKRFTWRKLFLCLLVIGCTAVLVNLLYRIFDTHSMPTDGETWLYLIVDCAALIWSFVSLNHYSHDRPGLILTIVICAVIVLGLSFMGLPALAGVKNNITNKVSSIHVASSSTVNNENNASNIAEVETMSAVPSGWGGYLDVELKPINAQANTTYTVDLYQNGELMQSQNITWNEPQINVREVLPLEFNLSEAEYGAYSQASEINSNWWKSIFSVTITN